MRKGRFGSGSSDSAYLYIAWASSADGTGFTMVFDPTLKYIAVKTTTVPIAVPVVGDFAGLWKKYVGENGAPGYTPQKGTDYFDGDDGLEVEISINAGFIVWRYVGNVTWNNLVSLASLKGADGNTPYIQGGYWYINGVNTGVLATGANGANGANGRGITSIVLTSTVGKVKTYTITFTDATTTTFSVTDGNDGADGAGGGGAIDEIVEVYIDFVDGLPYTYTCPVDLRFTTLEYEGAAPTLSVALNTPMTKYQDIIITPNGAGLVILKGAIASSFSFDVYIDFVIAGAETYKCPYALKFTAMEHEQANAPTLSIALNTNTTKYQVQTVTADAPGLVTLKATIL